MLWKKRIINRIIHLQKASDIFKRKSWIFSKKTIILNIAIYFLIELNFSKKKVLTAKICLEVLDERKLDTKSIK